MKFTGATALISAAYLASLVSAQIISITSPLTNTKYKAGQEAIISWVNPKVSTISQIVLAKGPSTALQPIQTIATNVNANDLKYVWKIPFEIESGSEYAFELGTSPDLAFAGPFTIEGGVGGSLPAGNGTSSSSGSSAPPVAAAPAPAAGNGGAATSPSSSTSSTSQTSHNANASHTSGANKQVAGQAVVALGFAAAVASQFF